MDVKAPAPPDRKLADNLKSLEALPHAPEWLPLASEFLSRAKYLPPDSIAAWRGNLSDLWADPEGPTTTISGVRFQWAGIAGPVEVVATATTLSYRVPIMPCFEKATLDEAFEAVQEFVM